MDFESQNIKTLIYHSKKSVMHKSDLIFLNKIGSYIVKKLFQKSKTSSLNFSSYGAIEK